MVEIFLNNYIKIQRTYFLKKNKLFFYKYINIQKKIEEETIIKKKKSIILFQKSVKKIQDLINQKKEEEIKNQNLEKEFKYYNSSLLSKNEINFRRFSLTEKKFVEKKNSLEGSTIEKSKEKGEVFYKLSKKANLVEKFALKLRQSVGIQNCSTLTLKISEMINDLSFDFNNFCKIMLYNEGFLI